MSDEGIQRPGEMNGPGREETHTTRDGLSATAVGITDVGRQRKSNQDTLGNRVGQYADRAQEMGLLYAVADGAGGHAHGEVASALAIDTLFPRYYHTGSGDPGQLLTQAMRDANVAVYQAGQAKGGATMATTLTATSMTGDKLYVGNIGDSRTYLIRGNQIKQLTHDHSLIGEQVRSGLLTEEQARRSAIRNVITRAVGQRERVEPDLFTYDLQSGDMLLLCSDGLHGLVESEEIAEALSSHSLTEALQQLIDLALERGGADNITGLAIRINQIGSTTGASKVATSLSEAPTDPGITLAPTTATVTDDRALDNDTPTLPLGSVPLITDTPTAPPPAPPSAAPQPAEAAASLRLPAATTGEHPLSEQSTKPLGKQEAVSRASTTANVAPRSRVPGWLVIVVPLVLLLLAGLGFIGLGRVLGMRNTQPTPQPSIAPAIQPTVPATPTTVSTPVATAANSPGFAAPAPAPASPTAASIEPTPTSVGSASQPGPQPSSTALPGTARPATIAIRGNIFFQGIGQPAGFPEGWEVILATDLDHPNDFDADELLLSLCATTTPTPAPGRQGLKIITGKITPSTDLLAAGQYELHAPLPVNRAQRYVIALRQVNGAGCREIMWGNANEIVILVNSELVIISDLRVARRR